MSKTHQTLELDKVVIRFAGDSGDGMQFTGNEFTFTAALEGNDLATFPDFPAEIRAPRGTVEGVSGFQIQIGHVKIFTPGDQADVLVAMNPAALRSNMRWIRKGGNIIIDADSFDKRSIAKAGYESNPLDDGSLEAYKVIAAPISSLTKKALADSGLDNKSVMRCRNMFVLGMIYWLFDRKMEHTLHTLQQKFGKHPEVVAANKRALEAGYYYAETVEALPSAYKILPARQEKGRYRHISGNVATAWGLMAAREKLGKTLFYGSYPITPASDVLHELAKHKHLGVITMQAEDEIAAVCSAIGASYAGHIGITASAGPGIALKGEAIGLAIMTELPLVVLDIQRGGPSTGLPTKTEQADLYMAMFGRNSESPAIVLAPHTPASCFYLAFEAVRLSIEHMTPVMFLSDAYLANGSEPWKFPKMADLPDIHAPHPRADSNGQIYEPYRREAARLSRQWAVPGMPGKEHRIGGLEKAAITGHVSYDPLNHEEMTRLRAEKVARVAHDIPPQGVVGKDEGELLVVGWGSTYGALLTAVEELQAQGNDLSLAHFNYLNPFPKNTRELLGKFNKILVCELNLGQLVNIFRMQFPEYTFEQYNKVQGLPFTVSELKTAILNHL
ncbi:MAG: 2-oxoacid:acceptor oxidoreductase subunit alpha [Bacteroidetes bacterium]|nr:MAG: 2-oxoacid:acceptor oxidoreductase subunit alpha [Bacteroidota bacterium]